MEFQTSHIFSKHLHFYVKYGLTWYNLTVTTCIKKANGVNMRVLISKIIIYMAIVLTVSSMTYILLGLQGMSWSGGSHLTIQFHILKR